MDYYRLSGAKRRTGDCSNHPFRMTMAEPCAVGILSLVSAILLFALPAKAEYLDDLTVTPHARLGLAFPGKPPSYYGAVGAGGMGVVRLGVSWRAREPQPGQFEWSELFSAQPAKTEYLDDLFEWSELFSAQPAKTEYLDDLTVTPHARLGLAFPAKPPSYYWAVGAGGMGVVRLDVSWLAREPQPGQYEWDGLDRKVAQLQALGIEPFLTFQSNAEWATRPETHGRANGIPINMSDWTTFVSIAVDRYNGDGWNDAPGLLQPVIYYQFVNEWNAFWWGTDQELVDFVNQSAAAVKQSDPSAYVVMGGITSGELDALVLNRGLADYEVCRRAGPDDPYRCASADYFRTPNWDEKLVRDIWILENVNVDALDLHLYDVAARDSVRIQAVRSAGWRKPLLSAECGGPSLHYEDYAPENHFMAVVERNLVDLSEKLRFCLWFRLVEGPGATFGNSKTALADIADLPKPGYRAYKLLAHILQDMTSIERGAGNSFTIHRQGRPPLIVAWLEDGQTSGFMELPKNMTGSLLEVTDPVLGTYEVTPIQGFGSVPLSPWPKIAGELP